MTLLGGFIQKIALYAEEDMADKGTAVLAQADCLPSVNQAPGRRLSPMLAVLCGAAAIPVVAWAQPVDGLYVGAGGGVNIMPNEQVAASPGLGLGARSDQLDPGFQVNAAVGYGFAGLGIPARLELQGAYFNNHFDSSSSAALIVNGYEHLRRRRSRSPATSIRRQQGRPDRRIRQSRRHRQSGFQ